MAANSIENTLVSLEKSLGVMVTVHDVSGVFCGPDGTPLLGLRRQSHRLRSPLCFSGGRAPCLAHCMARVNELCASAKKPFVMTRCPSALVELHCPIRRHSQFIGTLSAGLWRTATHRVPPCYSASKRLSEAYLQLEPLSRQRADQLGRILALASHGISNMLEEFQRVEPPPHNRQHEIYSFIAVHAARAISISDLARHLHLSPSRTGHLVAEIFGVPFAKLVLQERLRRAKTLLRSTDQRIGQIGFSIGFGDECSFNRAFRRAEGLTPGEYRRLHIE